MKIRRRTRKYRATAEPGDGYEQSDDHIGETTEQGSIQAAVAAAGVFASVALSAGVSAGAVQAYVVAACCGGFGVVRGRGLRGRGDGGPLA